MSSIEYNYEVLSTEELLKLRQEVIDQVSCLIEVPSKITALLLTHFNWDRDKLVEKYFESDAEQFFKKANIANPFDEENKINNQNAPASQNETCEICFCAFPPNQMTDLGCGHRFCSLCWREYLVTKIMSEGVSQSITCAAHECNKLVEDINITSLVDEPAKLKYQQLLIDNFVACNKLLRWCPAVNCKYAIKVEYLDRCRVICKCGHEFCSSCGEKWHDPVKCAWLKQWLKKCAERHEWAVPNAKECPKCRATISKDGGCKHVICPNCQHSFCWVCRGPWQPHGPPLFTCTSFPEADRSLVTEDQEWSQPLPRAQNYYYQHYLKHFLLLKDEKSLRDNVNFTIKYMQRKNVSSPVDVQFLKDAVDVLCRCRRTLMYTYVFAFFVEKCNMLQIFEQHQANFELEIQSLANIVEQNISEPLPENKEEAVNKYALCDRLRKLLLKYANDGFEEDIWQCRFPNSKN